MFGSIITTPIIPPIKKCFENIKLRCFVNIIPTKKEIIKKLIEYLFKKAIPQTMKILYQIFVLDVFISLTIK